MIRGRQITCDHPGCRLRFRGSAAGASRWTPEGLRRVAAPLGWSVAVDGTHRCPGHRERPAPSLPEDDDRDPSAERLADELVRALKAMARAGGRGADLRL